MANVTESLLDRSTDLARTVCFQRIGSAAVFTLFTATLPAHELRENLYLDGIIALALQCQDLSSGTAGTDTCRGAAPFQPTLTYLPTQHDTLFIKLGFATSNGLNDVTPFNITAWGADLKDDVKNINGSGRNHLLEAWYQHLFDIDKRNSLGITLGIIDATQYLDQNAYANDEYTQFMNPALSNAPNSLLPSYDAGLAAQWFINNWSFTGVVMDVHQVTRNDNYTFYGVQAGYYLETGIGAGNYRILINGDRNLIDLSGRSRQQNDILLISVDQRIGQQFGVFARLGWRLDDDAINYSSIYSGGVDIRGRVWNRALDNIGIGLVYLDGGNNRINNTRIAEAYYRMVVYTDLALTADIQYMHDDFFQQPGAEGFIYSLRATFVF